MYAIHIPPPTAARQLSLYVKTLKKMKKNYTVSLDIELVTDAQQKTANLSATLNELLKEWTASRERLKDMDEQKQLKLELEKKEAQLASLKSEMDRIKKQNQQVKIIRSIQ